MTPTAHRSLRDESAHRPLARACPKDRLRAPNTYSLGRYLGILFVILHRRAFTRCRTCIPPDFALQIRAEAADAKMTQAIVDRATKALEARRYPNKGYTDRREERRAAAVQQR